MAGGFLQNVFRQNRALGDRRFGQIGEIRQFVRVLVSERGAFRAEGGCGRHRGGQMDADPRYIGNDLGNVGRGAARPGATSGQARSARRASRCRRATRSPHRRRSLPERARWVRPRGTHEPPRCRRRHQVPVPRPRRVRLLRHESAVPRRNRHPRSQPMTGSRWNSGRRASRTRPSRGTRRSALASAQPPAGGTGSEPEPGCPRRQLAANGSRDASCKALILASRISPSPSGSSRVSEDGPKSGDPASPPGFPGWSRLRPAPRPRRAARRCWSRPPRWPRPWRWRWPDRARHGAACGSSGHSCRRRKPATIRARGALLPTTASSRRSPAPPDGSRSSGARRQAASRRGKSRPGWAGGQKSADGSVA